MELVLIFLISAAFAAICYVMASRQGRNTTLWGVLGFCFGPIAFVILAVLAYRS